MLKKRWKPDTIPTLNRVYISVYSGFRLQVLAASLLTHRRNHAGFIVRLCF